LRNEERNERSDERSYALRNEERNERSDERSYAVAPELKSFALIGAAVRFF